MTDRTIHVAGTTIAVVEGDITALDVDAIVNAANEHLVHGGGVAAAIARAAGPLLVEESRRWIDQHGPLRPGEAAVTTGGDLAADHVVHVVGPRYRPGADNAVRLRAAVHAALDAAHSSGASRVALPAISAGIFGYPLHEATAVIVDAVVDWVVEHPGALEEVLLVAYAPEASRSFAAALARHGD